MTNNACKVSKVYLKVESVIMVNDQCQRVLWSWFWVSKRTDGNSQICHADAVSECIGEPLYCVLRIWP